jgi:hypothetical protein
MAHSAWWAVRDPRSRRGSGVDHPLGLGPSKQGQDCRSRISVASVSVTSCTDERGRNHLVDRRMREERWCPRERFGRGRGSTEALICHRPVGVEIVTGNEFGGLVVGPCINSHQSLIVLYSLPHIQERQCSVILEESSRGLIPEKILQYYLLVRCNLIIIFYGSLTRASLVQTPQASLEILRCPMWGVTV